MDVGRNPATNARQRVILANVEPPDPPVSRGYPGIPVGFVDIGAVIDEGTPVADDGTPLDDFTHDAPYMILPCTSCWPWYAEVVAYGHPPMTWVREWHAVDCARWKDHLTIPPTPPPAGTPLSISKPGG
jgi:hypothetical protein